MAGIVLDFVDAAIQVGSIIAGIIQHTKEEQDYRSSWTQAAVAQLSKDCPGKNCLVVCTDHDASGLKGSVQKNISCNCPDGASVVYNAYIFDSGTFVLKGDGGYLNWAMEGALTRNGNTVNFTQLAQPPPAPAAKPAAPPKAVNKTTVPSFPKPTNTRVSPAKK